MYKKFCRKEQDYFDHFDCRDCEDYKECQAFLCKEIVKSLSLAEVFDKKLDPIQITY